MNGWLRQDGCKGIRNVIVVAYLVECAHHVARLIVDQRDETNVHLIGFPGCYPNEYAHKIMRAVCTHPNVGGAVLLSLGCEGFNREELAGDVRDSGRPVQTLVIQENGGTRSTVARGMEAVARLQLGLGEQERTEVALNELVIGTICGGSDGTSGITANPAVGHCFDHMVAEGAACIFAETGELIGCEGVMAERAVIPELAAELKASVEKAARYYEVLGYGSFAPGNAEGGLTTQEEKSMSAYRKLTEDMDINAGRILEGEATPAEVGDEIYNLILQVAGGLPTVSEELGHREFILTYKKFEPIGPACLPVLVRG